MPRPMKAIIAHLLYKTRGVDIPTKITVRRQKGRLDNFFPHAIIQTLQESEGNGRDGKLKIGGCWQLRG